ncbi:MAG: hypothetical protein NT098_01495 [Candidatus Parcubacteria bacterium]|nr:hypothetical protein [Candidatus Parcubacteria bacterium]
MLWSTKRRLFFIFGILAVFSLVGGIVYMTKYYQPPSCTDKTQNQGEEGPDCGGPCSVVCIAQVTKPIISWSRSFESGKGAYNAVAYIENPNPNLGVREATYRFKLYDQNDVFITERVGKTYIRPNEQFAIFEPRIDVGERFPKKTFFEFLSFSDWIKIEGQKPDISVKAPIPETGPTPRVTVSLTNRNNIGVQNINVVAIVYDNEDNAMAASASVVDAIPADSASEVVFTWPTAFIFSPARVEVLPRVDPFEIPIR